MNIADRRGKGELEGRMREVGDPDRIRPRIGQQLPDLLCKEQLRSPPQGLECTLASRLPVLLVTHCFCAFGIGEFQAPSKLRILN